MPAVFHLRRFLLWACAPAVLWAATGPSAVPDPRTTGTPFLRVWTAEEYGASPVNWHIVQHPGTGFIYAANNYGVLEYDGAAWRLLGLPNEGRASTLALDPAGHLWAAGDDIARLEPDTTGRLRARSQLDRLPESDRTIGSIVFSAAGPDFVAFASSGRLFVFPDTGPAYALTTPTRISSLWLAGDELQVTLNDGKMLRLRDRQLANATFSLGPPAAIGGNIWIVYDVKPAGPGRWRLATNRGLVTTAADAGPSELTIPVSREILAESQITAALVLANGGYACASVRSGLLVFDPAGRLIRQVQRSHGLPGNRIDQLCEDAEGGLWLAQRIGLTRIQLDSPFSLHGIAQGLEGGPRKLLRHAGRLFVGHNEGLAVSSDDGRFREIPGMRLGTNRLLAHAGRLFVTSGSLREVRPDLTLRPLSREAFAPLIALRRAPDLLLGGMSTGIWIDALKSDTVESRGRIEQVPGPISHLLDGGDGFVWASNPAGRIWRIDFRAGVRTDAPVRAYGEADGLLPALRRDDPLLFELGGEIIVSSARWLLRHDRATDRFVPETRIAGLDGRQTGATDMSRDDAGETWLRLGPPRRAVVRLAEDGRGGWRAVPLATDALAALVGNGLYADSAARTVWVAGQGALVAIALDWQPAYTAPPLLAFIRSIETPEGTPLLDPAAGAAALTAEHNALRVTFAAPTFSPDYRGQTGTAYRTRLDGLDAGWSEWSSAPHRDFTNLPYRGFTFRVQARDLAGRLSEETVLAFAIAPPWWLTRWAYGVYAGLGALLLLGFIQLRTRALRRRNEQLAAAVATRTGELHRQNFELARLHQLELDEKISAQLAEEKARLEVLRYQLNPHFLFNALNSVCAQIIREPVAARAMVVRLADFCRLTLHRPGDEEAAMTIGQELKLLGAYLEIEQARLGDLITVEIQSDPAAEAVRIPPFLLLPLVENAVKYGSATSPEHLVVRLTVRRGEGEVVEIEVANTGQWLVPGAHSAPSHGIGLENLRQRLARYYPGAHEFTTAAADGWVFMRLRLLRPLAEAKPA
ncbi:MAG: histidine kinase [Lacunisphaera sp.]|nr:histidine kinase [Lacunisphaera sp.]